MHKTNIQSVFKKSAALLMLSLLAVSCNPLGGGGSSAGGTGVAKTTNGGTDWSFAVNSDTPVSKKKNAKPAVSPLASAGVLGMQFSPEGSQKLYVATQAQGLFYSENSADAWKQILPKFNAYDFAIDPTNPDHIFVAGQSTNQARVLATINRGGSWEEVYTDVASQNIARSIVFDPANPKTIVVGLASGNLITSADGGTTWTLLQNFQDQVTQLIWRRDRSLFILTRGKGLYVTRDGGKTVQNISKILLNIDDLRQNVPISSNGDRTTVAPIDVPTQQTTAFYKVAVGSSNPQLIYLAANNGLFASYDSGTTWRYLKLPLRNTQTTEVRGLALADNDKLLYASVGNTAFKTQNGGESWAVSAIATGATINYILVDPTVTQIAYVGFIPSQSN